MQDVNGTLTCVPGKMPLAKLVQNYLVRHFPVQTPRESDVCLEVELARWFCPGCGVTLHDLACPACGRNIRSIITNHVLRLALPTGAIAELCDHMSHVTMHVCNR